MAPRPGIVVIVNPRSRANRRDPELAAGLAAALGDDGEILSPTSLEAMADEAARLAAAPPAVVAVHGGDGTLHKTVTALARAFGERPLPPLAILAGGTMNVVAASLGIVREPTVLLRELREDLRAGRPPDLITRPCLRVGGELGFVFGNGLMTNFLDQYYARDGYGPSRASWMLVRTFASALVGGGYADRMFRPFEGRVCVDGQELPWRSLTGVGAAVVREVGLGFKLNHRAEEDPARFGVLAIHARPLALMADLVPVHRGDGIATERAFSAVASTLELFPDAPGTRYTIDGDVYEAGNRVTVGLGPSLSLVRPHGDAAP